MKRILSFTIAFVICIVSLGNCFAENNPIYQYDSASFTLSNNDVQEKKFREWAAMLVEKYLSDNYAAIDQDGNLKINSAIGNLIEPKKRGANPISTTREGNKSQYAPYYWLALAKTRYDTLEGNGYVGKLSGNERGVIDYSNYDLTKDSGKKQELYIWILKETLKEHVAADPDIIRNSNYVESNYGYYVFDSETGTMKIDNTIKYEAAISAENAKASIEKALISATEVALKGFIAYWEFKEEVANIASSVTAKLENNVDLESIKTEFFYSLLQGVTSAAARSLDTAVDEFRKKINDEIKNVMTEFLAAELANMVKNGKRNVIGYLRSTYIDNLTLTDSSWQRAEFRQAAKSLIEAIDGVDESKESMETVIHDYAVNQIGKKEVFSNEMIWYLVGYSFIDTLVGDTFDTLQTTINSLLKEIIEKKVNNQYVKKIFKDPLVDFLVNDLLGVLKDWLKTSILQAYISNMSVDDAQTIKTENTWNTIFDQVEKDSEKGFDVYAAQIANAGENRLFEVLKNCINFKEDKVGLFDFEGKDAFEKYKKEEYLVTTEHLGISIAVAVVFTAFKPLLSEFFTNYKNMLNARLKTDVSDNGQKVQEIELKEITDNIDRINRQITSYKSMDKEYISGLVTELISLFVRLYTYGEKYDIDVWGSFIDILRIAMEETGEELIRDGADSYTLDVLNQLCKDKKFWELIFEAVLQDDYMSSVTNAETVRQVMDKAKENNGAVQSKADPEMNLLLNADCVDYNTAKKVLEDNNNSGSLDYLLSAATNILSSIWDSAKDFGDDFWIACHETAEAINGENEVSMSAARVCIVQWNSQELQEVLKKYLTSHIRTNEYQKNGAMGVAEIDAGSQYKNMNASEIRDPKLTPNLKHIYAVTCDILMQMTLDAVGMSAYLNFVTDETIKKYYDTSFYKKYCIGYDENKKAVYALVTLDNATERQRKVINALALEDQYDTAWDAFTR